MAKYIDANELMMRLRKLCDTTECNISIMPDVMEVIREMPDCGEPAAHAHTALDAAVIHKAATMDTLTPWIREQLADIAERMDSKC